MFGIDPEALANLVKLQQQIMAFMDATHDQLVKIEAQLNRIESELDGSKENAK